MNWQKARWVLAVLALLALSATACIGYTDELRSMRSLGQAICAASQLVYCILGVAAAAALIWRPRWSRPLLYPWAAAMTLTGLTAPVAWGDGAWTAGVFGGVVTAAIGALVIWLAWSRSRA
jgi:hypothetical protein